MLLSVARILSSASVTRKNRVVQNKTNLQFVVNLIVQFLCSFLVHLPSLIIWGKVWWGERGEVMCCCQLLLNDKVVILLNYGQTTGHSHSFYLWTLVPFFGWNRRYGAILVLSLLHMPICLHPRRLIIYIKTLLEAWGPPLRNIVSFTVYSPPISIHSQKIRVETELWPYRPSQDCDRPIVRRGLFFSVYFVRVRTFQFALGRVNTRAPRQ